MILSPAERKIAAKNYDEARGNLSQWCGADLNAAHLLNCATHEPGMCSEDELRDERTLNAMGKIRRHLVDMPTTQAAEKILKAQK